METSSAGRIFRTVCKLVTVAAVTLVLTPGLACQTRRVTQRSDQNWRTILHAEESPHASARAETLAIDRGGATVVAGSFTGVLRAGRYSIRSVSESAGFVLKIARDAVFDHAGAQTAAFPVTVDSSQSFFCCFAARSGDAFFVAGGQDGLFLLEMSAGGTQRTRAKWGVAGSPVGLGVAIDRRSIVGASAQPTDATFASYRSVVLRLN